MITLEDAIWRPPGRRMITSGGLTEWPAQSGTEQLGAKEDATHLCLLFAAHLCLLPAAHPAAHLCMLLAAHLCLLPAAHPCLLPAAPKPRRSR